MKNQGEDNLDFKFMSHITCFYIFINNRIHLRWCRKQNKFLSLLNTKTINFFYMDAIVGWKLYLNWIQFVCISAESNMLYHK